MSLVVLDTDVSGESAPFVSLPAVWEARDDIAHLTASGV